MVRNWTCQEVELLDLVQDDIEQLATSHQQWNYPPHPATQFKKKKRNKKQTDSIRILTVCILHMINEISIFCLATMLTATMS